LTQRASVDGCGQGDHFIESQFEGVEFDRVVRSVFDEILQQKLVPRNPLDWSDQQRSKTEVGLGRDLREEL
jgi:hypothetical protein